MTEYNLTGAIDRPTWRSKAGLDFLRKSFLPEPSQNDHEGRFDVVMNHAQLRGEGTHLRLLDLGSGTSLLLRRLIAAHVNQGHFTSHTSYSRVTYVAVDKDAQATDHEWLNLEAECKQHTCCFETPKLLTISLLNCDSVKPYLKKQGPFNIICLSNTLHELDPTSWPRVFNFARSLLTSAGILVVLDPEFSWIFNPASWTSTETILRALDWEIDAVWYEPKPLNQLLESLGFKVTTSTRAERTATLWQVTAERDSDNRPKLAAARRLIKNEVNRQKGILLREYANAKHRLRQTLKQNKFDDATYATVMRLAAISASYCRLEEMSEALS